MTIKRRTPVAPGKDPSPAAAAKSSAARAPASETRLAARSQVPAENPAVSNAVSPVADARAPQPPPSRDVGEGGGARSDDPNESENEHIVSPDSINTSRQDADNAKHWLLGQLDDGFDGFDKSGVSFKLYDICKHKHICAYLYFKF